MTKLKNSFNDYTGNIGMILLYAFCVFLVFDPFTSIGSESTHELVRLANLLQIISTLIIIAITAMFIWATGMIYLKKTSQWAIDTAVKIPFVGLSLRSWWSQFQEMERALNNESAVYGCQKVINNSPNWKVFYGNHDFRNCFYEISHENRDDMRKVLRHLLLYRIDWEARTIGEILVSDIISGKKIAEQKYQEIFKEKISPLRELIKELKRTESRKDVYQVYYKAIDPV